MLSNTCDACGAETTAPDHDSLIDALVSHYDTVHPEWGLTRMAIQNYLEATQRMTGGTRRLGSIGKVEVSRVTKDRVADVLDFFDHHAFADNPGWAACYCTFFHREDPQSNGNNHWSVNRSDLASNLEDGTTVGYLAYVDGKPAAWCNASPRSQYPIRRKGSDDDKVGVVVCFTIAPPYRRHGLARLLLEAAIEGFSEMGMMRVEGHPTLKGEGDAPNYHGPLSLFLKAGFVEVERNEQFALVSKQLSP